MSVTRSFPKGYFTLFGSEFTARFCFWAVQSILVIFLTQQYHLTDSAAYATLASYSALTFATTFLGGLLADKYFGAFKILIIGMALTAVGMLLLVSTDQATCFNGLSLLIVGMGLYVPANAALLDNLYEKEDPLRDRGYFYLYVATNIGGIFGPLCCGFFAEYHSFTAGFAACGILLVSSLLAYFISRKRIRFFHTENTVSHTTTWKQIIHFALLVSALTASVCFLLRTDQVGIKMLSTAGVLALFYFLYQSRHEVPTQRKDIYTILLFSLISLLFFAMEFQLLNSIITFTRDYVNKEVAFLSLPASSFVSLQPFFIVLLAPIINALFENLEKRHIRFTNTHKFSLGFLLLSFSFLLLSTAAQRYNDTFALLSPSWLMLSTLLMSAGEVLLMPVLLSLVTKKSPAHMKNAMVGFLYFCLAFASYLSGWVAKFVNAVDTATPVLGYQAVYWNVFMCSLAISLTLWLISSAHFAIQARKEG